jgi:class 3 adenylate cyclase
MISVKLERPTERLVLSQILPSTRYLRRTHCSLKRLLSLFQKVDHPMDESSSQLAQPTFEGLPAKKTRKKKSVRRVWSRGLPSLASSTMRMVVATLQLTATNNDDDDDVEEKEEKISIEQQLQAHIPDIVLHHFNDLIDQQGNLSIPSVYTYDRATLLFLDVSGFTSLTEQYSNDAHLGIDQLTHTLNSYFDNLVSEILINHGDIYKFAGDAILALWTNQWHGPEEALRCALDLQEKFGAYETDVGVVLRLKIALAYGPVRALFVGNEEFKHYILTGDCVKEVNMCEQVCEPGDIMITKAVHEQVQSAFPQCEFVPIQDEAHNAVEHIAVKYLPTSTDRRVSSLDHSRETVVD